jgi:glutaredoxin
MFSRPGCPRCAAAHEFLAGLQRERPDLEVVVRDVERDPAARADLLELTTRRGIARAGVPTFRVVDELVVGFDAAETTGARLRELVLRGRSVVPGDVIETRLLGRLSAHEIGLPLFTLAVGLLDGFNPCAMWVLVFVLALLVNMHDRVRMLLVGGTFVVVSGFAYFVLMAAWLNAFLLIGLSHAVELVLGAIASAIGLLNVKNFFAPGRGPSVGIAEAAKPGFYRRVRDVVQAKNLGAALAGTVVLAVLVNLIELACTAGLPALYTRILTMESLSLRDYYRYLALYNLAFMLDDGIVLPVAVVTLSRRKLQERGGRWLKLLSGLVMLGLGVAMLVPAVGFLLRE